MGIHGFVGKKTEDPQTLKLLVAASEYATAAMDRLGQDGSGATAALPQMIDNYVDTVFDLEVHFLFPNLSPEKRNLLVAIMKVRNSISAILNGASCKGSAGENAALEKLTADLQQKFLGFRSQIVASGIKEQLDPIQQKVFQDEFFSITLDKRRSTTLFFSTDVAPRPTPVSGGVLVPEVAVRPNSSFERSPSEEVFPSWTPLQLEALEPHVPMQSRSAQPVINRDVAAQTPDATPQLSAVTPQPSAVTPQPSAVAPQPSTVTLQLTAVTPQLTSVTPQPTAVTPELAEVAPPQHGVPHHEPDVTPHLAEKRVERRKTVLLISADSRAQDLIGGAMRQAGHSLLLANAGFTGYVSAMRERPDLVLVDLGLSLEVSGPDACLDGRGVLKMLSKLPSNRALPFIGLVAEGTSEIESQVLALGARACLQKPLDTGRVLDAVHHVWADRPSEPDEATRSPWTVSASV